jgi:hypothetical protein
MKFALRGRVAAVKRASYATKGRDAASGMALAKSLAHQIVANFAGLRIAAMERPTRTSLSDIVKHGHKAVVHMKLLMAVEECQTWIVSDKVNIALLVATKHHDILHDTGCGSPREIGQFESVTMKMDRMYIVAGIEHAQTVVVGQNPVGH